MTHDPFPAPHAVPANDGLASEVLLDLDRADRIGLEEAVYCAGKSVDQIAHIVGLAQQAGRPLLLTRLSADKHAALPAPLRDALDRCEVSQTARLGALRPLAGAPQVAIVCAGTSDVPVAREAERTLRYHGHASTLFADVGVAGLWRLTSRIGAIRSHPIVIVAAGMDAALPSVLAGLVASVVIAVPTSVGYGVAAGGRTALDAVLASCAPGIAVVNIDNGYGAACAALRTLHALHAAAAPPADAGAASPSTVADAAVALLDRSAA